MKENQRDIFENFRVVVVESLLKRIFKEQNTKNVKLILQILRNKILLNKEGKMIFQKLNEFVQEKINQQENEKK